MELGEIGRNGVRWCPQCKSVGVRETVSMFLNLEIQSIRGLINVRVDAERRRPSETNM